MRISTTLISILCLLCLTIGARANEYAPILYSRTNISLLRLHMPPLPWAPTQTSNEIVPLTFDVEVRDATTLYKQEGWFNLSSPSQHNGVMLMFSAPSESPIIRSQQYAPLDILLVDKEGKIMQIIPNVLLANLEQDIYPASPVLAFLFLKGGTCADLSIMPGDRIEYEAFKRPPVILSTPPSASQPDSAKPPPTGLTQPPMATPASKETMQPLVRHPQ